MVAVGPGTYCVRRPSAVETLDLQYEAEAIPNVPTVLIFTVPPLAVCLLDVGCECKSPFAEVGLLPHEPLDVCSNW